MRVFVCMLCVCVYTLSHPLSAIITHHSTPIPHHTYTKHTLTQHTTHHPSLTTRKHKNTHTTHNTKHTKHNNKFIHTSYTEFQSPLNASPLEITISISFAPSSTHQHIPHPLPLTIHRPSPHHSARNPHDSPPTQHSPLIIHPSPQHRHNKSKNPSIHTHLVHRVPISSQRISPRNNNINLLRSILDRLSDGWCVMRG